jgi:hypothetical protein
MRPTWPATASVAVASAGALFLPVAGPTATAHAVGGGTGTPAGPTARPAEGRSLWKWAATRARAWQRPHLATEEITERREPADLHAVSGFVHEGAPGATSEFFEKLFPNLWEVNWDLAGRHTSLNSFKCMVTVERRLRKEATLRDRESVDATAYRYPHGMEDRFAGLGAEFQAVDSWRHLAAQLTELGSGSRAVVTGYKPGKEGRFFYLAQVRDDTVYFSDPQKNRWATLRGLTNVTYLVTYARFQPTLPAYDLTGAPPGYDQVVPRTPGTPPATLPGASPAPAPAAQTSPDAPSIW